MRTCAIALGVVVGIAGVARAGIFSHNLGMSTLPSAQGYRYVAMNSSLPESQVFSLAGGVLTSNTMGTPYNGQGVNMMVLDVPTGAFEAGNDFVIEARVRTLAEERSGNHYGFHLGAWFDGLRLGVGIMTQTVQTPSQRVLLSRDNTQWTTWRIETRRADNLFLVYANGQFLFSDEILPGTGARPAEFPQSYVGFGDGTGGANARAEMSGFHFHQVPAPGAAALLGIGCVWGARRRRG